MEMNIDGFFRNHTSDFDEVFEKLKTLFENERIDYDPDDEDCAATEIMVGVEGLHKDVEFLVDTIKHNVKLWDAEKAKLIATHAATVQERVGEAGK